MAMMQWHALLAQERDQSSRRIAEESESQNEDPLLDDWKRELEADAAEWNLLRKSMRRARLAAVIPGIFLIVSAVLFLSQEQRFAWASLIGFLLSSAALIGYRSVQGRKVQELESRVQRGREAAAAQKAKDEMEQRHRAEREEAARNLHQRAEEAHQAVEMAFGRAFQADQQPDEGIQVLKRFEQLRDQLQHLQMSEAALRESMERIRPGSSRESAETLADRFNREAVHPAMDRTSAEKRLSELEQEIAHRSASWQKENNALIEMETQLRIRAQGRRHADTIQREWRMEREKLDRWEQDLAMIQCARAALQQAEEQARHHFSPRLNARATELFTSLTGQASRHIRVNTDFGLTLDDLGTSELMDWKRLSTGTMEQAYLALRMAVSEIAVARPALPLLMDDPMMSYDDARASRAVRFLADYAQQKGRQIFFFTSAGRYAEALSGKNFTWLDLDQMNEDEKTRKEEHHAE